MHPEREAVKKLWQGKHPIQGKKSPSSGKLARSFRSHPVPQSAGTGSPCPARLE